MYIFTPFFLFPRGLRPPDLPLGRAGGRAGGRGTLFINIVFLFHFFGDHFFDIVLFQFC